MAYRKSFLTEVERFERTMPGPIRTELGLAQFFAYESRGIRPDYPDPYFLRMLDGKAWWEWTLNDLARTYLTDEWVGWAIIEQDFADDPTGLHQVERRCRRTVQDNRGVFYHRLQDKF